MDSKTMRFEMLGVLFFEGVAMSTKEIRETLELDGVPFEGKMFDNVLTSLASGGYVEKRLDEDLGKGRYRYAISQKGIDEIARKRNEDAAAKTLVEGVSEHLQRKPEKDHPWRKRMFPEKSLAAPTLDDAGWTDSPEDAAFKALSEMNALLKPAQIESLDFKCEVLGRLALICPSAVSSVLNDVIEDLRAVG